MPDWQWEFGSTLNVFSATVWRAVIVVVQAVIKDLFENNVCQRTASSLVSSHI